MKENKKNHILRFFYLSIFGISFAFLETAVVIYLRQLYYPNGFQFPLSSAITGFIFFTEIFREFSTIIIMVCAALLCGQRFMERFAYFLYIFAVWDIFYYVFLKITVNWPSSILTWDVLFLIPIPWTSPVLFPVLSSVTMIAISIFLYNLYYRYKLKNLSAAEWSLLYAGAFLIFITFICGYFQLVFKNFNLIVKGVSLRVISAGFIPDRYYWEIFTVGELLVISALILILRKIKYKDNKEIKNSKKIKNNNRKITVLK